MMSVNETTNKGGNSDSGDLRRGVENTAGRSIHLEF